MEGGWKTKGKILRRQEIMESALTLFSQKGFHGTTMAEVARKAGVGVGTLYQHFRGKEDLYLSLLEERCGELLEILKGLAHQGGSTREVLDRMLEAQVEFIEEHRAFFKLYLLEQLATLEAVRERLGVRGDHLYGRFFSLFQEIMDEGVKRKELKTLPSSHLTRAFMGILNSFFFDWLKGHIKSLKEVRRTVVELFLEGAGQ